MKCAVFAAIDGPLHEVKLSPSTLDRLGVAVYGTVLLGGRVPCWAGLEAQLADGAVVVHEWILQHLGLADGQELVVQAAGVVLPRALSVSLEENASHRRSEVRRDGGADQLQGQLQGLRALRRQLTGLPIFANALCAVQWLDRVRVLRVQDVQPHEAAAPAAAPQVALIGVGTELELRAAVPQRAPCIASHHDAAELAHGDALLARMQRHVTARLPHAAASSDTGSAAAEQLVALAAGGGHVLLSGPAGGGKAHAMRRLAAWARRAGVATRCASLSLSPWA